MGTLFENLYSLLAYLNPQNPFQELAFPNLRVRPYCRVGREVMVRWVAMTPGYTYRNPKKTERLEVIKHTIGEFQVLSKISIMGRIE